MPMAELKKGFEKLMFEEVKAYLNSGNVIFSNDEDDTEKFTEQIGSQKQQMQMSANI